MRFKHLSQFGQRELAQCLGTPEVFQNGISQEYDIDTACSSTVIMIWVGYLVSPLYHLVVPGLPSFVRGSGAFTRHRRVGAETGILRGIIGEPVGWIIVVPTAIGRIQTVDKCSKRIAAFWLKECFWLPAVQCRGGGTTANLVDVFIVGQEPEDGNRGRRENGCRSRHSSGPSTRRELFGYHRECHEKNGG